MTVPSGAVFETALPVSARPSVAIARSKDGSRFPRSRATVPFTATVPAGTFETYRVEQTGGEAPITLYVTTAAPHRIVRITFAGQPIEMVLAK